MRPSRLISRSLIPLLLSGGIAGCDDTPPATPDAPEVPDASGPPVTITVSIDKAPALVAFRDGIDGAWQAATMTSPTTFEAQVHGPYLVTVVCENATPNEARVEQVAQTPDDERTIMVRCVFTPPTRHAVTGRMVQPGRVQLGEAFAGSPTADWAFNLGVRSGTYDLMARTADQIVLRRAIEVAGPVAVMPQIDVTQEGTALTDVAFTVTNAAPTEMLVASVHIDKPAPLTPFGIYLGPIATAKAVPDSALLPTDAQSASMQATSGSATRSLRRPFRVGGDTTYTLPDPVADVGWEQAGGNLSIRWSSVPAFDSFFLGMRGISTDGTKRVIHDLTLSPRFVAATGARSATLETALTGFRTEWRIDFAREHTRRLFVQRVASGVISTNVIDETINAGRIARTAPGLALDLPAAEGRLAAP